MSIPNTQTALKIKAPGQFQVVSSAVPELDPDEILVRVVCIAINPVDGKSADLSPTIGATSGCDFSGEVVKLGSAVSEDSLQVGERVCGCVFGNNPDRPDNGAFAQYVAVPAELVFKIPPGMSYETGATLSVGLSTVGIALYHTWRLPLPSSSSQIPDDSTASGSRTVLVYGGGTATGTLAIQMLRRSGLIPITTCSPRNFSRVQSLGAAAAFDYASPTCGQDIREFTQGTLSFALDCIADLGSMKICYEAIGSDGGQYLSLEPFPLRGHTRRSVRPTWIISLTMFNKPIRWKRPYQRDGKPRDREFAARWFRLAQQILDEGEISLHPHRVSRRGLGSVIGGLEAVHKGEVAGVKLVYYIGR
ncbi:GroES-like protein [Aspergillus sclerotiicarbonarius CBS 121057]|uniref:GroES-like protein n=1 Tax=Aspergillus sclerotiicarbonarius (strain CBS 121057 / IBT 28362) TaxID=1448318 RepID=A0A319ESH2_ASPSB|nr:GroES-like protein [Aspergillus sclerotiicarbonarius CBS 121057]